jgi:SAM-dependent methyltransferase
MNRHDELARRAEATYGAAADHFDAPALGFWRFFGEQTVARLDLRPGSRVLDLCCGSGESALAAARAVGPTGSVLGIDVSPPMIRLATDKARRAGLTNTRFVVGDAISTGLPDGEFDAVVCVFGVFFVADMPAFVAEMRRVLASGGALAVTTWGPGVFEPANSVFWEAVEAEPESSGRPRFNPWDELTEPAALRALLHHDAEAEAVARWHPLRRADDFWQIVLGSGYRATVDALSPDAVTRVRERVVTRLRELDVTAVRTDVVYGMARKP